MVKTGSATASAHALCQMVIWNASPQVPPDPDLQVQPTHKEIFLDDHPISEMECVTPSLRAETAEVLLF